MHLRVGVVGLGMMGGIHLRAWQQVDGAAVVAVCDADARRLATKPEQRGDLPGGAPALVPPEAARYDDLARLLDETDVNLVDLCVPTDLHARLTLQSLRAGRHVLCEKPMALHATDARQMAAVAVEQDRLLMIGHCLRFWSEYRWLGGAVRDRRFGRLRSVMLLRVSARPAWSHDGWMLRGARSGGAALDLHVHDVDVLRWWLGPPAGVNASASLWDDGTASYVSAEYGYPDGPVAVAEGGWLPGEAPFEMSATLVFERATAEYSSARSPTLTVRPANGPVHTPPLDAADAYVEELRYFAACVRQGRQPHACPPEDAAEAVRLVAAELTSARRGQTIRLDA